MSLRLNNPANVIRGAPGEYSDDERALLLRAAHQAIEGALRGEELDIAAPSPHLAELRAVFTTLHLQGELRGCVGYAFPVYPLYRTVLETAVAAAYGDSRFWPVTEIEVPELKIEISVLSPLVEIAPDQVEVGKHGLIITQGQRRGLLLPQVPVEHGWDVERFLNESCSKAGLPPDAWSRGAKLEAFTAEIFGDE
jgi:AmmeMemoRadiSam system protein A